MAREEYHLHRPAYSLTISDQRFIVHGPSQTRVNTQTIMYNLFQLLWVTPIFIEKSTFAKTIMGNPHLAPSAAIVNRLNLTYIVVQAKSA